MLKKKVKMSLIDKITCVKMCSVITIWRQHIFDQQSFYLIIIIFFENNKTSNIYPLFTRKKKFISDQVDHNRNYNNYENSYSTP